MALITLTWNIVIWHYVLAPFEIVKIAKNFIWFLYHFFSIPVLTRTLFSKWKRLGEVRHKRMNVGDFLATHFINFMMRIIGFFIRLTTIITGIISILLCSLLSVIVLLVWFAYPILVVSLFMFGVDLLTIK